MTLSLLLDGVAVTKMFQSLYGQMIVTHDVKVANIQYDSRKVNHGDMFVAIRGSAHDGHRFVTDAIARGARVAVVERDDTLPDSYFMHNGVVKIVVADTRMALAQIAANYYLHPARRMAMVGVTGTNGKTTTTYLVRSMLEHQGQTAGLIGTISYAAGNQVLPASHTTPESLELQQLLARMEQGGCTAVVMEVSSHALDQHRVEGIPFRVAIFTNLTQDHLDYHGTMEAYFQAKKILFETLPSSSTAVINADDEWSAPLRNATKAPVISYGVSASADVSASDVSLSMSGTSFTLRYRGASIPVATSLIGRFNVSNILASFAGGLALGISPEQLRDSVRDVAVPGRFERITSPAGWTAVIDYAHTPDALQKVLAAVRDIFAAGHSGRIITVFGCGGDRDRTKRPLMGAIASSASELTIVTSDNPRHENPEAIIDEVMAGVKGGAETMRIADRQEAITTALARAAAGDVVLIAGKGHEDYQVIGDTKVPFSDREVVAGFLRLRA